MLPALVAVPLALVIVVGQLALRAVLSRPRRVRAAPPTPDLRDEPPALVNLLVNQLSDAPQVASSTLLDLAARRVVEIHEVADDPEHTLIRLRGAVPPQSGPEYERAIIDRVARVAGDTAVPVSALQQRYADGGHHWQRRLVRHTILDARRRGLITRREPGCLWSLVVSGLAAALLLAPALPSPGSSRFWPVATGLAIAWAVLAAAGALLLPAIGFGEAAATPDRYTAKGRQVTAHWLGVAAWLRAHPPMRDLPPAAVAVWDRYLAYGVALDAARHAVRVLDFETVGHRDELWSHHTGERRKVRIRYWRRNRLLRPLGPAAAQARLIWAVISLPLWIGAGVAVAGTVTSSYLRYLLLALMAVQVVRAAYRLVRSIRDLVRPVEVVGTVLDITVAGKQHNADYTDFAEEHRVDLRDLPTHFYVVVDDGSSDVLRPWIVNRDIASGSRTPPWEPTPAAVAAWQVHFSRPAYEPGDRVRLSGQPWSRYVRSLDPAPLPPAGITR